MTSPNKNIPRPHRHPSPGDKHNRLTFIAETRLSSENRRLAEWECECGNRCEHPIGRVVGGKIRSCGCLGIDLQRQAQTTHGMKGSPTYSSWVSMKGRCESPTNKDYYRYGAVGIRVHERWMSFENFFADMGLRPKGTTIDRIDGTKGYEPGNCRWSNPIVQARNNKRFCVIRTPLGVMPIIDYAAHIGISNGAAHLRLKRGKLEGCQPWQ